MSTKTRYARTLIAAAGAVLALAAGASAQVPPEFTQVGADAAEIDFDDVLVAINCGAGTYTVKGVTFYQWTDAALDPLCDRSASNLTDFNWNAAWPNPFTDPDLDQLDEIYMSIGYLNTDLWVDFKGLSAQQAYTIQVLLTANAANAWDHGGSLQVIGAETTDVVQSFHLALFARGIPFVVVIPDIVPNADGTIRLRYHRDGADAYTDVNKIWSGIILSGPPHPPIAWPTDLAVNRLVKRAGFDGLRVSWVNHEPSTNGAPYDEIQVFADGIVRAVLGEGEATVDEATENEVVLDLGDAANADLVDGVHRYEIRVDVAGYINRFTTYFGLTPIRVAAGPYDAYPVVTSDGRQWQSDAGFVTGDRYVADWQVYVDPEGEPVDGIPGLETFGLDPLDPADQVLFSHFIYDGGGGRENHLAASFGIPDGTYDVRLYFWEFASDWVMNRAGQAVIEGSDPTYFSYGDVEGVYAIAPPMAWMLEFPAAEVKDGVLDIDLITGWGANGDVTLSALEVLDADPEAKSIADFHATQTDPETYELVWQVPEGADFDRINILSRMSGQRLTLDPSATSHTFTQEMAFASTSNEAFVIQARKGNIFYPMLHAGAGSGPMRINAGGAGDVNAGQAVPDAITARGLEWVSDLAYVDRRLDFVAPVVSGDLNYVDWIGYALGGTFAVQPGSWAETLDPPFENPADLQDGELRLLQQIRWCEGPLAQDPQQPMTWQIPINDGTYFVRLYLSEGCCVRATAASAEGSAPLRIYYNGLAPDDTIPEGVDAVAGVAGGVTLAEFDGVEVADGFLTLAFEPFCLYNAPYDNNSTVAAIEILDPRILLIRGDTDGNGGYTIGDGIQILERLFANRPAFTYDCDKAGDVDDDGSLQINDAILIFNYLFADGNPPAPPAGACGPDRSTDTLPCAEASPACP
ncbi:MAG: hypothetical protein JXP34_07720 [Planctomycetes bacterium]|nr:hypothetical protein [Planctomycetota bacterium]